jgi:hypothetical protein
VTSGYIPAKDDPGPDEILEALRQANPTTLQKNHCSKSRRAALACLRAHVPESLPCG